MPNFLFYTHRGITSIEFLLIGIPVLLIGLGAYELMRWHNTRHILDLALFDAARQASLAYAQPEVLEQTFEQSLNPLFISHTTKTPTKITRYRQAYFDDIHKQTNLAPWQITIHTPTQQHFIDFQRKDLPIALQKGLIGIDNNYQKEQDTQKGIGKLSGQRIFDANTLSLSLIYPYKPIVPGISYIFKQFSSTHNYANQLLKKGFLPIRHSAKLTMQSHPLRWPSLQNGKVINLAYTDQIPSNHSQQLSPSPLTNCHGIWCTKHSLLSKQNESKHLPSNQPSSSPIPEYPPSVLIEPSNNSENSIKYPIISKQNGNQIENTLSLGYSEDHTEHHPLCGISLCCSE
ncbi:TadE/TadG family type IV pilus assembly protein [Pelistega sp. MC2]|uniref:TadE/TadG family type IV pilus assembly protein n=1 Tax=Pelistega sp. MC2 TaxID=1720297 RepID=UPI0008DAD013|nr:TadE family protein [Pelistega sp. MC2]